MAADAPLDEPDAMTLRILLSTDNHLGYAEKDPVRGEDSFRTFHEILRVAQRERVDLLLLAGDLFHDAKPSRKTMYQTMSLLRSHCMGDGAVRFQVVSDQSINFPNFGVVNYEDPNYNIALPIFSIHGNHDDPSREGGAAQQSLAALDVLSAANFVNYFGKSDKVDAIEVFPVLLVKGTTRVAIYGLGNMRDERLNRMFAQQKVVFRRPIERPSDWFSVFVVHQNRDDRGRGVKNCLPESFIPDFIDFVVWGHEHECLIDPIESVKGDFYISQPGSSIATSLVEGEARAKHVAVLDIREQAFRLTRRALTSVRPFAIDDVVLSECDALDPNDPDVAERIHALLEARVRALLQEATAATATAAAATPTHPTDQVLVRVRVEHTGFPVLHNQRFGSRFVGQVANPNDILLFYRRKRERVFALDATTTGKQRLNAFATPIRPTRLENVTTIEDIVARKLHLPDQQLVFLPENALARALEQYVVKNMPSALEEFVELQLETTQRALAKKLAVANATSRDVVSAVEQNRERVEAEHAVQEEKAEETAAAAATTHVAAVDDPDSRFSQRMRVDKSDASRVNRLGTPRRTAAAVTAMPTTPATQRLASVMDSLMDSDDSDDNAPSSKSPPLPQKKKPVTRKPAGKTKTPPVRAATARKSKKPVARAWLSDDSDNNNNDDDDDDDYDASNGLIDDDDESESESESGRLTVSSTKRTSKKKPATTTRAAPKKRLRRQQSESDDSDAGDNDDVFGRSPARKRVAKATAKPRASAAAKRSNEIDLCSSDDEDDDDGRATTKAKATKAKTTKQTPQRTISTMFKQQQQRASAAAAAADDVASDAESDAEFTQLARRTGGINNNSATVDLSQASAAAPSTSTRRKLPLSMAAASQASSQGGADTARKGWGRSRR